MKKIFLTISTLIYLTGCACVSTTPTTESFEIPQEEYNALSEEQRDFYDSLTPDQKNALGREKLIAGYKNQIRALDSEIKRLEDSLRSTKKDKMLPVIVNIDMLKKERLIAQQSLVQVNNK